MYQYLESAENTLEVAMKDSRPSTQNCERMRFKGLNVLFEHVSTHQQLRRPYWLIHASSSYRAVLGNKLLSELVLIECNRKLDAR